MSTAFVLEISSTLEDAWEVAGPALAAAPHDLIAAALGAEAEQGTLAFRADVDLVPPQRVGVRAIVGEAVRGPHGVHVPLHWRAESDAFADFDGVLAIEHDDADNVVLALTGQYQVGAARDLLAVRAAALATGERLVAGVGERLAGARSPEELALPAGPLHVRDLMVPVPVTLRADLPLRTAVLLLLHHDASGAPVVDHRGRVVGVLTDSDLLAREATLRPRSGWESRDEDRRRRAVTVGDACSRPAVVTAPATRLRNAARELLDHDISALVVVDEGGPVGMLPRRAVLHALVRSTAGLQAAVDAALEPVLGVVAEVDPAGQVELTGLTARRSEATRAEQLVAAVDGVTGVQSSVGWQVDDRAPSPWFG